jgi:hypothetical protein
MTQKREASTQQVKGILLKVYFLFDRWLPKILIAIGYSI